MNRRAFTLLELLIAMAMLGIVAVSLFASVAVAFKARAAADRALEPSRTAHLAMEIIARDLTSALPPGGTLPNLWMGIVDDSATTGATGTGATGTGATGAATDASTAAAVTVASPFTGLYQGTFEGNKSTDDRGNPADDLIFFGNAQGVQHQEGANFEIKCIELTVVTSQAGNDHLLVRKIYNNLLAQTQEDPDQEVICRGVSGFNLRYWDPVNADWEDTWDCSLYNNQLPAAIEVTLQLDRPDGTGQMRTLTYVRVVPMPCSVAYSLVPATNGNSVGTTTGTGTGTGATGTGG